MAKLSFIAGFGAGYVLGAKAGRGRYEQIRRAWDHAKDDPRLQSAAGVVQAGALDRQGQDARLSLDQFLEQGFDAAVRDGKEPEMTAARLGMPACIGR